MKWMRYYKLTIEISGVQNAIEIEYPFTLDFNVSRNTMASANTGKFTIYNLSESTRRQIYHDRYDTLTYRRIVLQAGYQDGAPIVFAGNINVAYSYRNGVNWLTEIEAYDGGFGIQNGDANIAIPAGYDLRNVLKGLITTMPNVSKGAIGSFTTKNSRGLSLYGNNWDLINYLVPNANPFIDNEKVHIINKNEYIESNEGIAVITSESGLLETPRRADARIDVKMIFEPRAIVGQIVQLQSLETINNAQYQIIGVSHQGTISGAIGGSVITTLNLWKGTSKMNAVVQ